MQRTDGVVFTQRSSVQQHGPRRALFRSNRDGLLLQEPSLTCESTRRPLGIVLDINDTQTLADAARRAFHEALVRVEE